MSAERHAYGPDPAQYGELWRPGEITRSTTVVIVHGGFWRARYDCSLGRPLAEDLVERGYVVWNLEYRRVGAGGGWPATCTDVANGIDAMAEVNVDTAHVVAIGHSAGGHLATWAAGRAKLPSGAPGAEPAVTLHGIISQAGVLDLQAAERERIGDSAAIGFMGGTVDELAEQYRLADPLAAAPLDVPVVCLHSQADDVVAFSQSEAYVAAGGSASLRETFGDHSTLIDPASPDWAAALETLESWE